MLGCALLDHVAFDPTPAIGLDSRIRRAASTTRSAFGLHCDEVRAVRVVLERAVNRRRARLLFAAYLGILGLVKLEGQTDDLVGAKLWRALPSGPVLSWKVHTACLTS